MFYAFPMPAPGTWHETHFECCSDDTVEAAANYFPYLCLTEWLDGLQIGDYLVRETIKAGSIRKSDVHVICTNSDAFMNIAQGAYERLNASYHHYLHFVYLYCAAPHDDNNRNSFVCSMRWWGCDWGGTTFRPKTFSIKYAGEYTRELLLCYHPFFVVVRKIAWKCCDESIGDAPQRRRRRCHPNKFFENTIKAFGISCFGNAKIVTHIKYNMGNEKHQMHGAWRQNWNSQKRTRHTLPLRKRWRWRCLVLLCIDATTSDTTSEDDDDVQSAEQVNFIARALENPSGRLNLFVFFLAALSF